MARRGNRIGYREYRGRSGGGSAVLKFIIALLAILLLLGILFMVFFSDYLEYTDDGVRVHLPWMSEATPPPVPSDPVVIVSDGLDVTVEPQVSEEPTPEPTPPLPAIGVAEVSVRQLRDGSAANVVAAAGGNALVVEMKTTAGKLNWQSQVELASTLKVNADDDKTAQAVRALAQEGGLYLVARVQCFRDPILSNAKIGSLRTPTGKIWYDSRGLNWSSPACQETVDYLTALCLELADMGFDEILLDSSGYPDFGEIHVLATSENRPEDLTVPVNAFYRQLSEKLRERGVYMSVRTSQAALQGENVNSGVSAEGLARYADRVWLPAASGDCDYAAILTAAGMEDAEEKLVVKGGPDSDGSWYK